MDIDVQVIHRPTSAEKQHAYRQRNADRIQPKDAQRKRTFRASQIPQFIGVDGEGIGKGKNHKYVLLGVGSEQYENSRGISWQEAFEFLYKQFEVNPKAAFVGFYLGYDFDKILGTLPFKAAWSLFTKEGKANRRIRGQVKRRQYNAVKCDGWEIDAMGKKRLSIRPRPDGCTCYEKRIKCKHKQLPWMHICDAGSFFQMSLLAVLDKKRWKDDPGGWPITQAEYDAILKGKNRRDHAALDDEMRYYNVLENEILARVMVRLARGFADIGIKLGKDQWYGPGASASKYLNQKKAPKRKELQDGLMPEWFRNVCKYSYFGGWFEIFSHGVISGTSYNYDINNAYPFASTKLPHICGDCRYVNGKGDYNGTGKYVLLYGAVFSKSTRIGPVPYRAKDGTILRPSVSKGWYWQHEIEAAKRAGLVKKTMISEWAEFIPCSHSEPFVDIHDLYNKRLEVGKDSAQGMAIKLNNNSIYGKFAQLAGNAPFNNWLYASYITSHCRTQILDAIATHPDKENAVLMVATDGICFDSPHPDFDADIASECKRTGLEKDQRLGKWERGIYHELVLFKPGVYWHRDGKNALKAVKSRGVPKEEFMEACEYAELHFRAFKWTKILPEQILIQREIIPEAYIGIAQKWPAFTVPVKFRMMTCGMALAQGKWERAGEVMHEIELVQDSNPQSKRRSPFWNEAKDRIDTVIHDLPVKEIQTHYHDEVDIPFEELGEGMDGSAMSGIIEAAGMLRGKKTNYDMPRGYEDDGSIEWERVW